MSSPTLPAIEFGPATLDDLMRVEGKAELIAGRIVHQVASGFDASLIALMIAMRLHQYRIEQGVGYAFGDGMGFAIRPPLANGRQSFSPDAAYYEGPAPPNRKRFIVGRPAFAVEIRSENDYGPSAEAKMAAKRADYFEAGTLVVWDLDPELRTIASYRDGNPATPAATFRPGDLADAEPAAPGWRVVVDELFAI